jgi:cellulose synthase operon protein C
VNTPARQINKMPKNYSKPLWRKWPVTLGLVGMLVACSGDDPAKLMTSARDAMGRQEFSAAIIHLKNALQQQPESAEARFLLGKALLATGDAAGAESELRKAQAGGLPEDELVPVLAEAMLRQDQFKKIDDAYARTRLKSPGAQAALLTILAGARMGLNDSQGAREKLDEALKLKPDHAPANIEKARFLAGAKQYAEALSLLDTLLAKDASNGFAHKLKGDLLFYGQARADDALSAYQAAIKASPSFHDAQNAIVRLHLSRGKLDDAAQALVQLKKMADSDPATLFLEGQLALTQGRLPEARSSVQKVLKLAPDNPWALELAGTVEFRANAFIQAEPFLEKALKGDPGLMLTRRLLSQTYLRTGQLEKALSILPSNLEGSTDAEMLSVAGQVYMVQGNSGKAQEYLEKASALSPKDVEKKTSLAISKLMAGKSEEGFAELRSTAASDKGVVADMALISALVQRREFDKALEAISRLDAKRAKDPIPPMLRSQVLSLKGDMAAARAVLDASLVQFPSFFPTVKALAQMDVMQKKPQDAIKRFEAFLSGSPKHFQAMLSLADLKASTGARKEDVTALIMRATEAAPEEAAPRLMLVEYQLRNKEPKLALTAAQNAAAVLPSNPAVLDALGRAQVAAGEFNQALSTYGKLVNAMPQSVEPYMRMAGVHASAKNLTAAAQSFNKALEIQPELLAAQQGLATLALQRGSVTEALELIRTVQKQRPKEAVGYLMEGDVHAFTKNWAPALQAYQSALERSPSAVAIALKLHGCYLAAGNKSEAAQFAAQRLVQYPKDLMFVYYMGGRALADSDFVNAEKYYMTVLASRPNNAAALNNLAWVSGKLGRKEALSYAEKANAQEPDNPDIIDTWASLLAARQQFGRAVELQKKVVALRPERHAFKLTLARYLVQSGDKAGAKAQLLELKKLGKGFSGQSDVESLLQGL